MAKISRHGGPSISGGAVPEPAERPVVAFVSETGPEDLAGQVDGEAVAVEQEHPGTGVAGEGVESTPDGTEHTLIVGYETWLISELRDECARRGLPKSGNKDELVARLLAADEPDGPEG